MSERYYSFCADFVPIAPTIDHFFYRAVNQGLQTSSSENLIKYQFSDLISGRQVRVKHIRYGHELKEIALDKHYDFNFQVSDEFSVFALKSRVLL